MKQICVFICFFVFINGLLFSQQNNRLYLVVENIAIFGNDKTKDQVIIRELNFSEGDTINLLNLSMFFKINQNNLLKTNLFNFVTINLANVFGNHCTIKIEVEERWYFWPEIYLAHADRNYSNWIKNFDWARTKYGAGISHYNVRGRREKLSMRFICGFVNTYAFTYNNLYVDKKRNHALNFEFYYDTPNKLVYNVQHNEELIYKSENKLLSSYEVYLEYDFRKALSKLHTLRMGYLNYSLTDSLLYLNPRYIAHGISSTKYLNISYSYLYDQLDSRYYPHEGFFISPAIRYTGIGVSALNYLSLRAVGGWNYTYPLIPLTYSNVLLFKYAFTNQRPIYEYDEIGYSENLRGFEYYVINGKFSSLFKNTLKYRLMPKQVVEFKYVPIRAIRKSHFTPYVTIFTDIGYVGNDNLFNNRNNNLNETLLYTFGFGFDLSTYYDRVLSLYFAYNSLNKAGVYFDIISGF